MISDEYHMRYRTHILNNRRFFNRLIADILRAHEYPELLRRAKIATSFALTASTGYYSSPDIEHALLQIASTIHVPLCAEYTPDSFLHVMTRAYLDGGHTRVVERWIEMSDSHQKHSLLITNQSDSEIPSRLKAAVNSRQGALVLFDKQTPDLSKGGELRRLASGFQTIILHAHMHDVVPMLAFGSKEFTRPVLLFNHADHKFWLGVSIADFVAEFRTMGQEISLKYRGVSTQRSAVIGLATETLEEPRSRDECISPVTLADGEKLAITVGFPYKYRPFAGLDFKEAVRALLSSHRNLKFVAIGPDERKQKEWAALASEFQGRFSAVGIVPHDQLKSYLKAASLALDSFPMSGGTALLDFVAAGVPVLSLRNPVGQLDYIRFSEAYCADLGELISKAGHILHNQPGQDKKIESLKEAAKKHCSTRSVKAAIDDLYRRLPDEHRLYCFESQCSLTELDMYLESEYKRRARGLRGFFTYETRKSSWKSIFIRLQLLRWCRWIIRRKPYN